MKRKSIPGLTKVTQQSRKPLISRAQELREEEELNRLDREEELKRRWNMKGIGYDVVGGKRRLQVYIPNSLYAEAARVAGPRGLTDFVAQALVEYVGQRKKAYKKG